MLHAVRQWSVLHFESDYLEGAHPHILRRLTDTNLEQTPGYGTDEYCESARHKIREACGTPDADVHFLVGGTQTNTLTIRAMLRPHEGVLSAESGHIATHEAGAIEASGHKVLPLPHSEGKIAASDVRTYMQRFHDEGGHEHIVTPGMVYISQPTEYGTLYSLSELEELSDVCRTYSLPLFADGARLGYALATPENDVTLPDLARLVDVFYIGGTKVGALFGEALVFPSGVAVPGLRSIIKQNGALLAKGRLLGIQFDALFTDRLYSRIAANAVRLARKLREGLEAQGYEAVVSSPTNQQFVVFDASTLKRIQGKVAYTEWERLRGGSKVVRLVTSWATREEDVNALLELVSFS